MKLTLLVSIALFNEFLALNADMKCHNDKLVKMLEAQKGY